MDTRDRHWPGGNTCTPMPQTIHLSEFKQIVVLEQLPDGLTQYLTH